MSFSSSPFSSIPNIRSSALLTLQATPDVIPHVIQLNIKEQRQQSYKENISTIMWSPDFLERVAINDPKLDDLLIELGLLPTGK